jgi:hypothetical protein
MADDIKQIASSVGWRGSPNWKTAEPAHNRALPVIDNSNPYANNVRTSIDCYVSGSYFGKNGKTFEVVQRYTVFVAYSKETMPATLQAVRQQIVMDFEAKYGKTFNVTNVYVPDLRVPKDEKLPGLKTGQDVPIEMYMGSSMFRDLSRYERMKLDVGTEKLKAQTNIASIRKRYKWRK